MEYKTDALLLRAADYGENDKMVTLLTADRGKIGAAMKGVKKAGAKLRFAAQPFCFAEYVLAERAGRYTVISASLHDGFYSLREDVTCFYAAAAVCETCNSFMYEGIVNGQMLVCAVTALKEMEENPERCAFALVRFLLRALSLAGYPVSAGDCPACGKPLGGKMYFDLASGSFFCGECAVGTPASESTYRTVRAAQNAADGEFRSSDGEKRALRMLKAYYAYQTEGDLPALGELIRML